MTKRYVDEQMALAKTFKNSSGSDTDPTAVTFTYRIGRDGQDREVTPVKSGTSTYTATFAPARHGQLYGFFKGTGTLIKTIPVNIPVFPNQITVG